MDSGKSNLENNATLLLYRCECGNEICLEQCSDSVCDACQKIIPADLTHVDHSATVSLEDFHSLSSMPEAATDENFEVVGVDPLIGQHFGHFKLINRIGRGGMGYVYRAVDVSLRRFVAVKVLKSGTGWKNNSSSSREVEMLLQEAVSQARVNHPNVVTIFYVGKKDDEPFFAMEMVHGTPLSDQLRNGALDFPPIVNLGLQVANALKFAHQLDIIHGDIKPSNLLVQEDNTVKLSDFGMARRESKTADSASGGTPNYLAPELIGGGETSIQSDIYAFGVTLYEMTFGSLPVKLTGRKIEDWTEDHRQMDVAYPTPWPEHLPEEWKNTLGRMLHKDPAERYQSWDEVTHDLKSVEALSGIKAKLVPRLLAGLFDYLSVLLVAAAIQYLLFDVLVLKKYTDNLAIVFFVSLADMIPILMYSAIVFFFRQSVGRNLLYLRVVNQYGVKPRRPTMLLRSFVRMGSVWLLSASMVFHAQNAVGWPGAIRTGLACAAVAFLATQIGVLLFNRKQRTIQDMVYKTDVVLDT